VGAEAEAVACAAVGPPDDALEQAILVLHHIDTNLDTES
jgi:hypothetical protein